MIDLYKLHEHATHAQVHGYLLKCDGSEIRQLVERLREAEKDASRYRALVNNPGWAVSKYYGKFRVCCGNNVITDWFESHDAALDAAMAAQSKE